MQAQPMIVAIQAIINEKPSRKHNTKLKRQNSSTFWNVKIKTKLNPVLNYLS